MTALTPYILLILMGLGGPPVLNSIEFSSQAQCEQAKAWVVENGPKGQEGRTVAVCVAK